MKPVEIFIKPTCPYCKKALAVLKRYGVEPTIVDLTKNPNRRQEMITRSGGGMTVPQIFIDGELIGGCDELVKIEKRGMLEETLGK